MRGAGLLAQIAVARNEPLVHRPRMCTVVFRAALTRAALLLALGLVSACHSTVALPGVLVEPLPGSVNQFNGTWWGYNQTKLVRRGNRVVTYVIKNDFPAGTPLEFALYQKLGDAPWTPGAALPTSRPGNLLVDAAGAIHALVFEAADMSTNDSVGALRHYTFAAPNDITAFTEETAIDNDGGDETVNIRVGGAIGPDDTLYAGFGLDVSTSEGQTEVLYQHATGDARWTRSLAGTRLGHDFYYAYLLPLTDGGLAQLAIQDDLVEDAGPAYGNRRSNRYQMVRYFEEHDSNWTQHALIDLSGDPLASQRLTLLQTSDFYQAEDGSVHVVTAEFLDPTVGSFTTSMRHDVLRNGAWSASSLAMPDGSCNWMRLFESGGRMFTLCQTWDSLFIRALNGATSAKIDFPGPILGGYPYLAAPRGGTRSDEGYLDIVVISGDSNSYPNGPAYYVRIPKASLLGL